METQEENKVEGEVAETTPEQAPENTAEQLSLRCRVGLGNT